MVRFRRYAVAASVGIALLLAWTVAWKQNVSAQSTRRAQKFREVVPRVMRQLTDSLDNALVELQGAVDSVQSARDSALALKEARTSFAHARAQYKRLEGIAEFYVPALASALNSRRQEVDDDDAPPPSSLGLRGFPALEENLWSRQPNAAHAHDLIDSMRVTVAKIRNSSGALVVTESQLFELARLEITRMGTLSIAGFDTPVTHDAMSESAAALDGLRMVFAEFPNSQWSNLHTEQDQFYSELSSASQYLRAHSRFEDFDHLQFIVGYFNPLARSLETLRRGTGVTSVAMRRGWRSDVGSVYDSDAFDPQAYAADDAPAATGSLIKLGERLFSDPTLSANGKRSCATCHLPSHAFTDGASRQSRIDGKGVIARHTPTLLNAALSPAQFADERSITLEEQALRVMENPNEMGGSIEQVARAIEKHNEHATDFRATFGDSNVTSRKVRYALAAYVRSLVALDSRFDKAARGDTAQLTPQERRGFSVFMGKAGCGTCHFAPLFNGNTPPLYLSADVEVIGTPSSADHPRATDADSGRSAIDRLALHYRAFKTPTVRNTALTAPFMHNGAFRSLEEVIRFYEGGGGVGAGAGIDNQTLASDKLSLSDDERAAIIAFIGSLTDTVPTKIPKQRPVSFR